MLRSTRFIAIAIAAAAIAPAANATLGSTPGEIDPAPVAGIVVTPLPAPFPLPADPIDIPGRIVSAPGADRTPAAAVPKAKKPSAAKQKGYWGTTATPKRPVLITDNAASQNQITLRNLRRLAVRQAKHASVPLITDNSPSQNHVASRKAAATRQLASTLHARPE